RRQAAHCQAWTERAAIGDVHAPVVLDLIVRVRAHVDPRRKLHPLRRLEEHIVAREEIGDDLRRIVRRLVREDDDAAVDEAALAHARGGCSRGQGEEDRKGRGGEGCRGDSAESVWPARPASPARPAGSVRPPPAAHWRRIACRVKSSSFRGTLYSSLSSVRRVRLPRLTSVISSCRAVQMPCTFWMSA